MQGQPVLATDTALQAAPSVPTAAQPSQATSPSVDDGGSLQASTLAVVAMLAVVLVVGCAIGLYFLPTLIAASRRKRNTAAIFALNLFLGWSLLGWVLALIWSLSVDPPPPLMHFPQA